MSSNSIHIDKISILSSKGVCKVPICYGSFSYINPAASFYRKYNVMHVVSRSKRQIHEQMSTPCASQFSAIDYGASVIDFQNPNVPSSNINFKNKSKQSKKSEVCQNDLEKRKHFADSKYASESTVCQCNIL
jgi:hypothetical protein